MKKIYFLTISTLFLCAQAVPVLVLAKTSNDPLGKQWFYTDIGAYKAWDVTTGSKDVVVAVIDNGFDATHPDIKGNVWENKNEIAGNNIDDDKNGFVDDISGWNFVYYDLNGNKKIEANEKQGNNNPVPDVSNLSKSEREKGFFNHGTLVAGLIGAVGNNNKAGTGLNWNIRLMNLKVLENSGIGDFNPLFKAIYYAVDNGADVINISAVGDASKELERAIDYAYDHGVVVVAAAGNNAASLHVNPLYPACSDATDKVQKVLGVSAINEDHQLADFSNYGSDCIDITAPGVHMASTMRYDTDENLQELFEDGWNGTSFATPLVSGAAALIKSVQPDWKASQIYEALLKTTHHSPTDNEAEYRDLFGAGLLQVDKAVKYAADRLPVSKALKGFGFYRPISGTFETQGLDEKSDTVTKPFLRKLSVVTSFTKGNETYYLTKRVYKGDTQMTVYDGSWTQLSRFTLAGDSITHIFVDNFLEQGVPQIVLVMKTPKLQMALYSLDGKKIKTVDLKVDGEFVFASRTSVSESRLKRVALLSKNGTKNEVHIFDMNGKKENTLVFPSVGTIIKMESGDFDGNKKNDFVFLSKKGVNATVSIVDSAGKIAQQFPVAPLSLNFDIQMIVGDYNKDKKDDIITFSEKTGELVVWKYTGLTLAHKSFKTSNDPIFITPSF